MNTTFLKQLKFTSLFKKNRDGSLSPKKTLSILGIVGNFNPTDKIKNLKLIDGTVIHDHEKSGIEVRKLGSTFMIMKFS